MNSDGAFFIILSSASLSRTAGVAGNIPFIRSTNTFDSGPMLDYNVRSMISTQEILIRLALGALIGGIIGFEREIHGRAAGFRTQLIVCVAAVLIMIVSENYYFHLQSSGQTLRIDPARISAGAIIGIGFLGGGVIIKSGLAVRGLTTAALIWIVSAIGLAIGGGLYFEAIAASAITIIALVFLREIEKKIKILQYKTITVSAQTAENAEETVTSILLGHGMNILSVDYENSRSKDESIYSFSVSTRNRNAMKDVFNKLGALKFVKTVRVDSRDRLFF